MQTLIDLYISHFGDAPLSVEPFSISGSARKYYRMDSEVRGSVVGVIGSDIAENKAFIYICRHFRERGINVPELYAVSSDNMCYLQEDLGDGQLYRLVSEGRTSGEYSPEEQEMLCKAVASLPKIQFLGAREMDYLMCYPDKEFNARMVDFDLNYFKYCFLKPYGIDFHEVKLQDDFDALKDDLLRDIGDTFMYRDFQSRNVIMRDGEPWFIDFQGGRRGPIYYDVASFIWQARSKYPAGLKEKLVETYLEALSRYVKIDRHYFNTRLRKFVLFRTLQVLGAYGFRGKIEHKAPFLASIPLAFAQLKELLSIPFTEYPYLTEVLLKLIGGKPQAAQSASPLTVKIISFSYRKGLPSDESGNGGGYVFDCRSVHNPGRYERYMNLTGLDAPVQAFLEEDGEILAFLESVYSLVDAHVARFVERGFTNMQVSFGCTGGQHRSVYSAEKTAAHIKEKFGVKVLLEHRELSISKEI